MGLWLVIPAAGQGSRTGLNIPKQYVVIGKRTILEWTLLSALSLPFLDGVVIAAPEGGLPKRVTMRIARTVKNLEKPVRILVIEGGETRQESVFKALSSVPEDTPYIGVHDACRPFCSKAVYERVYTAALEEGAAIPGVALADTLKVSKEGRVIKTLDRSEIFAIQTPQIFSAPTLRESHLAARQVGYLGTDDSSLVERSGHKVKIVPGDAENWKVTYEHDIARAKDVFKRRGLIKTARAGRLGGQSQFCVKVGFGYDIHPFVYGRSCILGGVTIENPRGLAGHSDADVVVHAAIDAILGAFSLGDIGTWFPTDDPKYLGISSLSLLQTVGDKIAGRGSVVHLDLTIIAEEPKIAPHAAKMRDNIADALSLRPERVSVKATTSEGLGALGRKEGIAACALATVSERRTR